MELTKLIELLQAQFRLQFHSMDPFEAFKSLYESHNMFVFKTWVEESIKQNPEKLNSKASILRNEGNSNYANRALKKAVLLYTKSLAYASYNGIEYGKALANRSAALFDLGEYAKCLIDIDRCFKSEYPEELRTKVQLRQMQCFHFLNMSDKFELAALKYYNKLKGVELFRKLLNKFEGNKKFENTHPNGCSKETTLPPLMNHTFAYATNLVKLSYSPEKGRHVIADKDLEVGDILFQEKAFVAAPIFDNEYEFVDNICYNCFKQLDYTCIPCECCTYCLYCDENCKEISWGLSHQFECIGMIMWYKLGQGLPAFKFVVKGITSNFHEVSNKNVNFGGYIDNYPYANSLLSHFDKRTNKSNLLSIAILIVIYLKNYTTFFDFVRQRLHRDVANVEHYIGGLLVKHMSQLFCNGSIIEISKTNKSIAAGIYPSVSMMNHSCRPNITIEYDGCTMIVKAAKAIPKGSEIFNNYGIDYQTEKRVRRDYLKENFYFDCECAECVIE